MADGADIARADGVLSGAASPLQRVTAAPAEAPMSLGAWARKLAGRAIVYALFPIALSQAFALRRHALRLVPAVGPPNGKIGRGEPLHFLAIGDSIIAGVGARRIRLSTVGHVVRFMSGRLAREINWHSAGMIGASAKRVRRDVLPQLPQQPFDAILLSVGVNDVLKLERSARFRQQLRKLIRDLRAHSPNAVIAYLGLPPLDEFPKLRRPLRWVVGLRVRRFDAVAREAVARVPNALYIPMKFSPRPDLFADDGLHASETGQRMLAKIIAAALTPRLGSALRPGPAPPA